MSTNKPKAYLQIGPYVFYDWAATGLFIGVMFLGAAFFLSALVLVVKFTGHPFSLQ